MTENRSFLACAANGPIRGKCWLSFEPSHAAGLEVSGNRVASRSTLHEKHGYYAPFGAPYYCKETPNITASNPAEIACALASVEVRTPAHEAKRIWQQVCRECG